MDITTTPGTKVVFAYPENGWPFDRNKVKEKGLSVGREYTVGHIEVFSSASDVYLEEFPGVPFNSVHFANV